MGKGMATLQVSFPLCCWMLLVLVICFSVYPETIFGKTLTSSGFSAEGDDREQKIGCGVASRDATRESK